MEPRHLDRPLNAYERSIGIADRWRQVFRVLVGEAGCCPRPDGRWSTDAIVLCTRHDSSGKKAREMARDLPQVIEREYLDQKTDIVHTDRPGDTVPAIKRCARPVVLFRLAAQYDPRRRHETVEQLVLI